MKKRAKQTYRRFNQNGQALIQSIFALGVVMLILAGAGPLGSNVSKQLAQARFNSEIQSLNDALVAVTTNPALCEPTNPAVTWMLPANPAGKWSFSTVNGVATMQPTPVIVTLPFKDSLGQNIRLTQMLADGSTPTLAQMPPQPLVPGNIHSHWQEFPNGGDKIAIGSLEFVPNPNQPLTNISGTYTALGTLQFSAFSSGTGTIASGSRTVANIQVIMNSSGQPQGCQVMQSPQQTCAQFGGMWNANLNPQCRFGFKPGPCPGNSAASPYNQYITKLNGDGTVQCSTFSYSCPKDSSGNYEALIGIYNNQFVCVPVDYTGIQFAVASETVAQGQGDPNIILKLAATQPLTQSVSVTVNYSGGQIGTDYNAPASPFTVTFPAGQTTQSLGSYGFSILSSGSTQPVQVQFQITNPQPAGIGVSIGSPYINTMTISGGAASCPAQTMTWSVSGKTCSGGVGPTGSGSTATATSTTPSGAATFACNNGAWGPAQGATCSAGLTCAGGTGTLVVAPILCIPDVDYYAMTCFPSSGRACPGGAMSGSSLSIGQCCRYATTSMHVCPMNSHNRGIVYCNPP